MNPDEMNLRQKKIFVFSGFASVAESQKLELIHKLQSLNGLYYEIEYFKPTATHLIACQPSLSQKFLGACASGKWILLPRYIEDSLKAGTWLPEKEYEWHKENAVVKTGLPSCMYSAPRTCREKVLSQKAGMFSSWKVAVLLQDKRRKMAYTRILELGDAQIVKCKLETEHFMDIYQSLTHIFIEKEREESVQMLLNSGTPFLTPDYIRNFLLTDPPPSYLDFVINNYQHKIDYFSRFASRIFSGSTKQCAREQLKPVIEKLEFTAPSFIDNCISNANDGTCENETANEIQIEETDNYLVQSRSVKLNQELTLNCVVADSMQLSGLNKSVSTKIKQKQRREKKLKSANFDSFIRRKKFCRRNTGDKLGLKTKSKVSSKIFNYIGARKSSSPFLKHQVTDSSKISDVIKERWKLHLQHRNFCSFSNLNERKMFESSEIPLSSTALFEPSLIEEEYENAIDLATSFLSHENYLQHHTLRNIVYEILQKTEEEKLANKTYHFLHRVLYLHPPLNLESRHYYIKALFPSIGEESLWKHLLEMISSTEVTENYSSEVSQSVKNKMLLLNFIISVLREDFHRFLKSSSYPPLDVVMKDSRPLVVSIFWHRGEVGAVNHKCRELFSLLAKFLSSYKELEFQRDSIMCLQYLIALLAECCQLAQREQKVPEIFHYLGPRCDKFALTLVLACSDVLHSTKLLMLLLTTFQSQWLKVKTCLVFLDQCFLKWHFKPGSNAIPFSLRKIVQQYMFPTATIEKQDEMNCHMEVEGWKHLQGIKTKSSTTVENEDHLKDETALHLACKNNEVDRLRMLLNVPDIDINAKDSANRTPLHEACSQGHLECVEELLKWHSSTSDVDRNRVDLLVTCNEGITPLHISVRNDHVDITRLLIKYGGKSLLKAKTTYGFTPLDFAHSSEMSNCLETAVKSDLRHEDITKNDLSPANFEDAHSKESNLTTETLLTADQVHIYLLLIMNLLYSYMEMHDLHKLTNLLRELSTEKEEISEDEQNTLSEKQLQGTSNELPEDNLNRKRTGKTKQGIIHSLLERHLMHEPSLNTELAVADDLYVAQEFHKHQMKYEEHLKTLCAPNVSLPKDLLNAIQLITL